jgi:hypothetical protein
VIYDHEFWRMLRRSNLSHTGRAKHSLITAIARGRRWLDEIMTGSIIDAEQLAKRGRCTVRQINPTLCGEQPRFHGIGLA